MKIPSLNLGKTCVQKLFLTFRTIFVYNMFSPCSSKTRASDKDLPANRPTGPNHSGLYLKDFGKTPGGYARLRLNSCQKCFDGSYSLTRSISRFRSLALTPLLHRVVSRFQFHTKRKFGFIFKHKGTSLLTLSSVLSKQILLFCETSVADFIDF